MRYRGFCGGSAQAASLAFQNERTMNWFVERAQGDGAKSPAVLLPTPGFQRWALSANVGGRAAIFADGRLFFVMGGKFCEYDVNGTETIWGSVAQDGNLGQIAYNGPVGGQLLIASGSNAYCFVLATNTFSQVLTGKATMVAYCKTYFLAFELSTGKVYLSNANDGTTWSLTTYFQRSDFADRWQAMFVDGNNLVWLPGTDSFEVWSLSNPTSTQPFAPLSGLVGRWGIAAPFAFGVTTTPYWLSRNPEGAGLVIRVGGSGAEPVGTYALANVLATYARTKRITDAEVLLYQDSGHTHFTVNFPTANASWTQTDDADWAERGKWNAPRQDYDLWAPRVHVYAFGKQLVADRATGTIWQMDASFATDTDGNGIRRLRRAPALYHEGVRKSVDCLLLKCDVGVGLQGDEATTQGVNPKVMCRASGDGGMTFGNERTASFGRIGEYRRRVYWNRWGLLEDACFEVTCAEPVPLRIVDAFLNPSQGEWQQAA
jgi:hypothetical protein